RNFGQANKFILSTGTCGVNAQGSDGCRSRTEKYFVFRCADTANMQSLRNMVNAIPSGYYVIIYSAFPYAYSTCDPAFNNALSDLGFNPLTVQDSIPFIFFCQKGNFSVRDSA